MINIPQIFVRCAHSYIKHLSRLRYDAEVQSYRLSKIICTIGPASRDVDILEKCMAQGMNIARLNFSHGSHDYHAETMSLVRQAAKNYSEKINFQYPVAIALDTKGPEIRTGLIGSQITGEVVLNDGETIKLTTNEKYQSLGSKKLVYVDYPNIVKLVQPGDRIYVDDGLISLIVEKVESECVNCTIENGGKLGSSKGVNLPGIDVDLPAVSEKDKQDLKFGLRQHVDMVFASFIRDAQALKDIRDVLGEWGRNIKLISKIENHQGMQNIDEIINASDGIMVARGDLGIELPAHKIPTAQKTIIARCNLAGKPVICATQMLESMTQKPRPTRAEVSDVGNAVLDGADCVMLSGETAKGSYPLKCIEMMSETCKEAESIMQYRDNCESLLKENANDSNKLMYVGAIRAVLNQSAVAIIVITSTGESAFELSRYRPPCPIILVTDCPETARAANLYRGVFSFVPSTDPIEDITDKVDWAIGLAMQQKLIGCELPVVVLVPKGEGSGFPECLYIRY